VKLKLTKELLIAFQVRRYIGNLPAWNYDEEQKVSLHFTCAFINFSNTPLRSETFMCVSFQRKFVIKAGQIRDKADHIYNRFKVSICIVFY
jgi:hypothetical protein